MSEGTYQCKGCRVLWSSPFFPSHAYERVDGESVPCTHPGAEYIPTTQEKLIMENIELLKEVKEKLNDST